VTNLANLTALANILGYGGGTPAIPPPLTLAAPATSIYSNVQSGGDKFDEADKDEGAALYELYKYFNSMLAFSGQNSMVVAAHAPGAAWDDYPGASAAQSAAGQGLTSGFALTSNGKTYVGPSAACSKNFVIYISNNAQRANPWPSSITYDSPAVSAAPIIGATTGIGAFYQQYTREWVRFLTQNQIQTYILDAFKAQQNVQYSKMLQLAVGTDKYYQVGNEAQIEKAVSKILVEIQSVNGAFAATSLPASATNRSVSENEVYLGVFRPDQSAGPRWFGNLKRYQIILNNGNPDLGDAAGISATNSQTGFLADCSASFWNSDTSGYQPATAVTAQPYWQPVVSDLPSPKSSCPAPGSSSPNPAGGSGFPLNSGATWNAFSDLPDGPIVEKGGAAEVLRRGNVSHTTAPTWQANNRTIKTLALSTATGPVSSLPAFTSSATGVSLTGLGVPAAAVSPPTLDQMVDFIQGWDVQDENGNTYIDPNAPTASTTNETRPSIHGDVIHSTPQPITYNGRGDGVVIYYGSNDGLYHAINAQSGVEIWSFLAPEFYSRMYRLYAKSPQINYPNLPTGIVPTPTPKDYFFDGPTGVYQSQDNSKIWIYPSMRRGGRMIYAFDVSPVSGAPPTVPTFLWKAGCATATGGCTSSSMDAIGQTWSTPQSILLKDGSPLPALPATALAPAVIFGGGYDSTQTTDASGNITSTSCEDQNTQTPSCGSRKGNVVYVVDGHDGPSTLLKTFTLPSNAGSVAGDVALLDINGDGYTDYAYFADTNGFVYRIDFVDGPTTLVPLAKANWRVTQIAGVSTTANYGHKFLFTPTLVLNQNKVYVGLGTGDREHPLITAYSYTSPVANHFYMFVDDPALTPSSPLNLDTDAGMVSAANATCTSPANVVPANTGITPHAAATPIGWYLALNNGTGEQTVTPALVIAGQATWGTNRPLTSSTACTNGLGEARGYLVSLLNGSGAIGVTGVCGGTPSTIYPGGGLPIPPTVKVVPVSPPCVGPSCTTEPPPGPLPGCTGDCNYYDVCIGCPPKNNKCSPSNISACDVSGHIPAARKRVYWFTPDDK
jgi:Tfp pilus tip-associated adhesin PilY1